MPHFRGDGHYRPRPDKYKHKKPKSRNPWSPNYDDSPKEETGYVEQPQDYSQGYVNPYVNTPDTPVFDTPSIQDNAANLQDFMDSNKPPHLQNRWKRQPERFTFSQPVEKCGCEPKQEDFEYDINENASQPYSRGGLGFEGEDFVVKSEKKMSAIETPVWERKRPIWEKKAADARDKGDKMMGIKKPFNEKQGDVKYVYYTSEGEFLGSTGKSENATVYVLNKENFQKHIYTNAYKVYEGEYNTFLRIAGLAYSEPSLNNEAIKMVPFCVINHHNQLINSGKSKYKDWDLGKTVMKMRGYSDKGYADNNPIFKTDFLGLKAGDIVKTVDLAANAFKRNENKQVLLAFEATIHAMRYMNGQPFRDLSDGSIGWHGKDIKGKEFWHQNLSIRKEHLLYEFADWKGAIYDKNTQKEEDITTAFISTHIFAQNNTHRPTIFYKSTIYAKKQDTAGML